MRPSLLALALFALPCCAAPAHADTVVATDAGTFTVKLQDTTIATDSFHTSASACSYDEQITLGSKVKLHAVLTFKRSRLVQAVAEAGSHGTMDLRLDGAKGMISLDGGAAKPITVPSPAIPFGNLTPHLYAYAIAAYDQKKAGPQKLTLLATEIAGKPGGSMVTVGATLNLTGTTQRQIGIKALTVRKYAFTLAGTVGNVDTEIDTDTDGRILLWKVPGQGVTATRSGYEALARADGPEDPLLSKPIYSVKKQTNVRVRMRDGVELAADVYLPDAPGKYPVILERTPYGRSLALDADRYARRGYAVVAQDVRGRGDSNGGFQPFVNEAQDGYDTVEWCAAQPWSTESVGMIGASYGGFVQWAAAREGSSHLKCLVPIVSPPDPFFNVPWAFGELFLAPDLWWVQVVDGKALNITDPMKTMGNLTAMMTLPLTDVDKKLLGHHVAFFQEWLRHSTDDAYWDKVDFDRRLAHIGPLPALHVSGWFDGDGIGTKLNYAAMVDSGHANQRLIYGPWSHAVNTTSKIGPIDFGPQSLRDLDTLYLRWFDHWLKGVDNGVNREAPVEAFLMGTNVWRSFSQWPPRQAHVEHWYLHSDGRANADHTDGWLSPEAPSSGEKPDRYAYDPAKPFVPGALRSASESKKDAGELDLSGPETSADVLRYTSQPMAAALTVAGPISLHLCAASSARDTDWFAALFDVRPDGKVMGLCQGILRARFRASFTHPTLLKPGVPEEYTIDLWALGNVFQKGHRLQVIVTSSCFPTYARNLNTGGDPATDTKMVIARQTVYHVPGRESYLELPVLER